MALQALMEAALGKYILSGLGRVWGSIVSIEEVGLNVPSTNLDLTNGPDLPGGPMNLRFASTAAAGS
jgi:hypothetical protein